MISLLEYKFCKFLRHSGQFEYWTLDFKNVEQQTLHFFRQSPRIGHKIQLLYCPLDGSVKAATRAVRRTARISVRVELLCVQQLSLSSVPLAASQHHNRVQKYPSIPHASSSCWTRQMHLAVPHLSVPGSSVSQQFSANASSSK